MSQSHKNPHRKADLETVKLQSLIICAALIAGMLVFGVVVLVLTLPKGAVFELSTMVMVVAAVIASTSGASFVVGKAVLDQQAKALSAAGLEPGVQQMRIGDLVRTSLIIRFALLEGGGMLAFVITLVEQNMLAWCLGFVPLALMILQLPFPGRFDRLVEQVERQL